MLSAVNLFLPLSMFIGGILRKMKNYFSVSSVGGKSWETLIKNTTYIRHNELHSHSESTAVGIFINRSCSVLVVVTSRLPLRRNMQDGTHVTSH